MADTRSLVNRLFFSINSGRSGSQYLAELIGSAKEVTSYHEPEPTMTGDYLRMVNEQSYADSINHRRLKSEAIKSVLSNLAQGEVYCETSHMFIKTFFDVVMDTFPRVEVIVLRRELALVLKSFIELGYFSSANKVWQDWMTSPNAKTAALPCLADDENLDQYDRCIAYLFDIEARAGRFQQDYPLVKIHETRLESLNNYSCVEKLFISLGITPTQETKEICGRSSNARIDRKKHFNISTDLNYCRERISMYIEKAKLMGILLPNTLALKPYE